MHACPADRTASSRAKSLWLGAVSGSAPGSETHTAVDGGVVAVAIVVDAVVELDAEDPSLSSPQAAPATTSAGTTSKNRQRVRV